MGRQCFALHFGKTNDHQWAADRWWITKTSFFGLVVSFSLIKTYDAMALTHMLHLNVALRVYYFVNFSLHCHS